MKILGPSYDAKSFEDFCIACLELNVISIINRHCKIDGQREIESKRERERERERAREREKKREEERRVGKKRNVTGWCITSDLTLYK